MLMTVGLTMSGNPTKVRIDLVGFRQVRMWCRVGEVLHGMRWEGGDWLGAVGGFSESWGVVGLVGSGVGSRGWT